MSNAEPVIKRMKNQKINYDRVLKKLISQWEHEGVRPRILLHNCCTPCSTYTLEYLSQHADITIYFANPNIHPKNEYLRRAKVQAQLVKDFNEETGHPAKYIETDYQPYGFMKMAKPRGLTDEPEGGKRCTACFEMRLELVTEVAVKYEYNYFGSALTLFPKKNAQLINELGMEIQRSYNTYYLPSDFKKNKGYERFIEMCNNYSIFRQCYCGCVFAAMEQGINFKKINREAKTLLEQL